MKLTTGATALALTAMAHAATFTVRRTWGADVPAWGLRCRFRVPGDCWNQGDGRSAGSRF